MLTPVAAARQCLTQESATVLDEAVAAARRRGHAQTTSLHMVSSLLALPSSSLREACTRTRSNAYPTRVQLKALELSLSVSLDRLPSSQAAKSDAPPVSNSLMAAIKRSQANQRRQPENFSFYHQQQQYSSSSSSSPSPSSAPLVKVELQNLIVSILDDPLVSRVFAEAGFRSVDIKMATLRPGNSALGCTSRYKRANPPLFLCNLRNDNSVRGFSFPFMGCFVGDDNSRRIGEVMLRDKRRCPLLLGVSAADALARFLETVRNKGSGCGLPDGISGLWVECVRDEISRYLKGDCDDGALKLRFERVEREVAERGGVVVDFGDLGALIGDGDDRRLKFLVGNLGRLVEVYGRKLWLIGMATPYEVYFKILKRFSSIEEDWQLGVLPITSSFNFSMGGGGGASYPRSSLMESFVPLGGFFSMPPETKSPLSNACHLCNDKYEQEVAAVSNAEKRQSLLQTAEAAAFSSLKGTDGRMMLSSKIAALQKKWGGICQQHHQQRVHAHHSIPRVLGFQVVNGTNNRYINANSIESSVDEQGSRNASSIVSTHDLQRSSSLKELSSSDAPAKQNNHHLILSPNLDSSTASVDADDRTSPTSVSNSKWHFRSGMLKDPKMLYRALLDRVGPQEEALSSIVEAITQPGDNGGMMSRRNVWINVRGADALSKKKLGLALAETLYATSESLVYIDLCFPEETTSHVEALLNSQITSKYDVTMRATVVDYLVDKLSKKPCVVFFDNVDRADLVVQNSLSQAVRSGRFTDWCGREANVSNCIFIGATKTSSCRDEEDALNARGSSMEIVVRFDMSDDLNPKITNKRKLKRPHKELDLNLNLVEEESEIRESQSDSERARTWMESFDREVDLTVDFKGFDFVKLGEKIFKSVEQCVENVVGCECAVEVEEEAMQQIMGAVYLYGVKSVEKWIDEVVKKGFVEGMGKYSITGRSIVRLIKAVGVGEEKTQGLLPARVTMK